MGCCAPIPKVHVIDRVGDITIYVQDKWIELEKDYLEKGDKVKIGPDSKLKINLGNGNIIILRQNTILYIGDNEIEIDALAVCRG